MRKISATIASILLVSALALPTAVNGFSQKKAVAQTENATNQNTQTEQTEQTEQAEQAEQNALVAPDSYEEYLQLNEPSCIAVCENYTAIADGNAIYLYDRAENEYRKYTHTVNAELSQNNVNQLQFDGNENLYFLDGSFLFLMETAKFDEFESATATTTGFPCDNFLIDGDFIYYVEAKTPAVISKTELASPNVSTAKKITDVGGKPDLAMFNGELYFIDASAKVILYKVNPQNPETLAQVAEIPERVEHMTVCDGTFAYTTPTGDFYVYALSDSTENGLQYMAKADGYTRLTSFGTNVYVAQKAQCVIKEYSVQDKAFTDFEISSNSSANQRLNKATDVALYKDEVFIADNGNKRLSVFDSKTNVLSARFPLQTEALYVAGDETAVITASQTEAYIYTKTGETLASFAEFNGVITGVSAVYGTYYVVTENNYFYSLTQNEANEWIKTEVKKTSTHPPQLLTTDVYGNLYIKNGVSVYKFSENEFMQADGNGTQILNSLTADATKIAIDYDCNVYASSPSGVFKYLLQENGNVLETPIDISEKYVYGDSPVLTAFAFGVENNATYLLFNGNFLVQTTAFHLPTVKNIPVDNADESIFAEEEANFEIVKTAEKSLLIAFDVQTLNGADVFPYLSYQRSETEKTALKIGESANGKYNLIAHFDGQTSKYSTYLVLKEACTTLPSSDYRKDYAEEEQTTAWLTNGLALYKFPYLCDELVVYQNLPRGAQITLLGEIGELDHDYYRISYVDENGVVRTGYIPQSYTTPFDASPKDSETTIVGETESNREALYRLAYILLGFGAVCILVDFLILRKKKDD